MIFKVSWGRLLERPSTSSRTLSRTVEATPRISQVMSDPADIVSVGGLGGPNERQHMQHTQQISTEDLRARFARKANLSDEHHDALVNLTETDGRPVVLFDLGTEHPAYGRSWS